MEIVCNNVSLILQYTSCFDWQGIGQAARAARRQAFWQYLEPAQLGEPQMEAGKAAQLDFA
jgi:hypothetical protein